MWPLPPTEPNNKMIKKKKTTWIVKFVLRNIHAKYCFNPSGNFPGIENKDLTEYFIIPVEYYVSATLLFKK